MRSVRWTTEAKRQQLDWLLYLADQDERLAKRAFAASLAKTDRLSGRPFDNRHSRWPGLRELSLTHWKKIAVYQVTDDEVIIIAFYDARQDLARVAPKPETD